MSAILCIWNNVSPGQEAAYENWYWQEHLPQRVAHPGFQSGRRYFVRQGHQRYYTLYELNKLDDVRTGEYADSLNTPSERSREMMGVFRDVCRAIGEVTYDHGRGIGGILVALRVFHCPGWNDTSRNRLVDALLAPCAKSPGTVRLRLLETRHDITNVKTEERRLRSAPDGSVEWAILLEAESLPHAKHMERMLQEGICNLFGPGCEFDQVLYDLAYWEPGTHPATFAPVAC